MYEMTTLVSELHTGRRQPELHESPGVSDAIGAGRD